GRGWPPRRSAPLPATGPLRRRAVAHPRAVRRDDGGAGKDRRRAGTESVKASGGRESGSGRMPDAGSLAPISCGGKGGVSVRQLTGIAAALLLGAFALSGCGGKQEESSSSPAPGRPAATTASSSGGDQQVVIAWAQWPPATALQELAADFTAETKIPVKVEQIPWPQFQDKITTGVWAGKSDAYDLIGGENHLLGTGANESHTLVLD